MDILVKMRRRERIIHVEGDEMLMEAICFIEEQVEGCIRTRFFTGHPYRSKYWWVVDRDVTILSTVEIS